MIARIKKIDFYIFFLKTCIKIWFLVLNNSLSIIIVFVLFFIYFFNFLSIIIFNDKEQLDICTSTIIKMVPKHLFSPFTWYIRGGGYENKWTTEPPGNIINVQAFGVQNDQLIAVLTFCILNFLWRLRYKKVSVHWAEMTTPSTQTN